MKGIYVLLAIVVFCFALNARAQFLDVATSDSSDGAPPLSSDFDPDTDIRSRSELPTDPAQHDFIEDTRFGLGERFSNPVDDDDSTSSSASLVTPMSAFAIGAGYMAAVYL